MTEKIDAHGPQHVYVQLAAILRARIKSGQIPRGRAIPSKRALKEEFGVSDHTVDRAVAVLRREGWVWTLKGRGIYVKDPGDP